VLYGLQYKRIHMLLKVQAFRHALLQAGPDMPCDLRSQLYNTRRTTSAQPRD